MGVSTIKGSDGIIIYKGRNKIYKDYMASRDHGVILGKDGLLRLQL